jgi:hypothetical protein
MRAKLLQAALLTFTLHLLMSLNATQTASPTVTHPLQQFASLLQTTSTSPQ